MRSLKALPLLALVVTLVVTLAACGGGPPSSVFNSSGYHVRGDTVYYLNAFPGSAFEIEQADAESFTILDSTYAKDKDAVYLNGGPLADADPASFALLDEPDYSKDATHVFLNGRVLSEDVAGFAFLDAGGMTKDGAHVYWSDGTVLSDDPDGFTVLSDAEHYLFTKDSDAVHVNGTSIPDADPATLEVVGGAYASDARRVYYFTNVIANADAPSLEVLDGSYARDDARVYWMGKVVPGADPESFVVLNPDFECTADAEHAFYRDLVIKDFDPGTIPEGATVSTCTETSLSHS